MANCPCVLDEECMVPVAGYLGKNGGEILNNSIAILTSAGSPFGGKSRRCITARSRPSSSRWTMTLPRPRIQKYFRYIAVLRYQVRQVVELVACLNVVGSGSATLEERRVLVELIMLVRIVQSEVARIWRSRRSRRLLKTVWVAARARQRLTQIINSPATGDSPNEIGRRSLPSKVMIILKEIPESRRQNHAGRSADVSSEIVGRIRG